MANETDALTPERLLAQVEWVRRLAAALVGRGDADEVVQQSYLQALSSPPRTIGNLRGWLTTVVRNVARYRVRVEDRRANHERRAASPAAAPDPAESVARAEVHRRVVDAVLALDEPYRGTLLMRFFDDQPADAIARAQSIPVETVRTRVKRGLAQLRARMGDGDMKGVAALASGGAGGALAVSIGAKWAIAAVLLVAVSTTTWLARSSPFEPVPVASNATARAESAPAAHAPDSEAERSKEEAAAVSSRLQVAPPGASRSSPRTIRGVVRDRHGHTLPNFAVWGLPNSNFGISDARDFAAAVDARRTAAGSDDAIDGWVATRSDADGRFELRELSSYTDWRVGSFDPDQGAALSDPVRFDESTMTRDVVLQILPRVHLKGTVRDERGEPIGEASVSVRCKSSAFQVSTLAGGPNVGAFDADWVYDAPIDVTAYAWGFERSSATPIEVETCNQERVVDLVLHRAEQLVSVRGAILDEAGAAFDLQERVDRLHRAANLPASRPAFVTTAAFDDRTWVPAPKRDVVHPDDSEVRRPELGKRLGTLGFVGRVDLGRATYETLLPADFHGEIALAVDGIVASIARLEDVTHAPSLLFSLAALPSAPPRATLAITVVDAATGDPIADPATRIDVERATLEKEIDYPALVRTTSDGVHEYSCRLGRYAMRADHAGFAASAAEIELTRSGERREVTLRLDRACAGLRGRSLLADGKPNAEEEVRLYRSSIGGWVDVAMCVETNDSGAFEILGLANADYVVVVQSGGFDTPAPAVAKVHASNPPTEFEMRSTEATHVSVKLVCPLRPAPPPTMFRFVDADGIPVVNMFGLMTKSFAADHAGAFLIPGRYRLFVWSRGCREGSLELDVPPKAPLELHLDPEE